MVVERWSVRRHVEILRTCQLYDYDGMRWLSFDGVPTTEHSLHFEEQLLETHEAEREAVRSRACPELLGTGGSGEILAVLDSISANEHSVKATHTGERTRRCRSTAMSKYPSASERRSRVTASTPSQCATDPKYANSRFVHSRSSNEARIGYSA